jgi:hypothetical protein
MLSRIAITNPIGQKILATTSLASTMSFYNLSATTSNGESVDMEGFKGKVVYATNVASK